MNEMNKHEYLQLCNRCAVRRGANERSGTSDGKNVSFILNWIAGGDHAPVYTAKSQGWHEDADIDLTIQQGRGADLAPVFNIYASSPYGYY